MILDADIAFSIRDLIYIFAIVGGGMTVWFGLKYKVENALSRAKEATDNSIEALKRASEIEINILKNYPANNVLEAVERRLSTQLNSVQSQLTSISDFLMGKNAQ